MEHFSLLEIYEASSFFFIIVRSAFEMVKSKTIHYVAMKCIEDYLQAAFIIICL